MYLWDMLYEDQEKEDLKIYLKYLIKERPKATPYHVTNCLKNGDFLNVVCHWNYVFSNENDILGFIYSLVKE